jgi:hypothetical protein
MLLAVRAPLCLGTATQSLPYGPLSPHLWPAASNSTTTRHSSRIPDLSPHQTPANCRQSGAAVSSACNSPVRRPHPLRSRGHLSARRGEMCRSAINWIGIGSAVICVTLLVQPVLNAAFLMTVTPSSSSGDKIQRWELWRTSEPHRGNVAPQSLAYRTATKLIERHRSSIGLF